MYADFESLMAMEALRPEIIDNYKSDDKDTTNISSNSAKSPWYKRIGGAIKKIFTTIIDFFKSIGEKIKNFFSNLTKKKVVVKITTNTLEPNLKKYIDSIQKTSVDIHNDFNSASDNMDKFYSSLKFNKNDSIKVTSKMETNYQKFDELTERIIENGEALHNLYSDMSTIDRTSIPSNIESHLKPFYDILKDTYKSCEKSRHMCEDNVKSIEKTWLQPNSTLQYADTGVVYSYRYNKRYLAAAKVINASSGIIMMISNKLLNHNIRSNGSGFAQV